MNTEEFGKTIKAKHPEYQDMSDFDVGTKMLSKYPQYKDMVDGNETSLGSKIQQGFYKIPVLGDIAQVIGASTGGLAAAIKTPQIQKQTMANQEKSRQLAIAARSELDPETKKKMLDESRRLSQEAGERASEYSKTVDSVMPEWSKNKESPTKNNVKEMLTAYGVPSARAGLAAGELVMLFGGGVPKMGPQGAGALKALGRIGVKTAAGSTLGAAQGFTSGDNKTIEERVESAKTGAEIGGILSFLGSAGGEAINGIKNVNKTKLASDLARKVTNTKDKISLTKSVSSKIDELMTSPDAPKVNYDLVKSKVESRAMTLSGKTRDAVLSNLDAEPNGFLTLKDAIDKKRGAGFSINASGSTAKFNELMREELAKELHNVSPQLENLDNLYHVIKSAQKSKFVKKAITGIILGSGTKVGWNLFNK